MLFCASFLFVSEGLKPRYSTSMCKEAREYLRYVIVASTPPAVPPAISDTSGDFFDACHHLKACQNPANSLHVEEEDVLQLKFDERDILTSSATILTTLLVRQGMTRPAQNLGSDPKACDMLFRLSWQRFTIVKM